MVALSSQLYPWSHFQAHLTKIRDQKDWEAVSSGASRQCMFYCLWAVGCGILRMFCMHVKMGRIVGTCLCGAGGRLHFVCLIVLLRRRDIL